jgi:FdhE protein
MTIQLSNQLGDLGHRYPEWLPWLTVIDQVLHEAADPVWDTFVPESAAPRQRAAPLLAGATLAVQTPTVTGWSARLLEAACRSGTAKMSALDGARAAQLNAIDLFQSSLCQCGEHLRETAADLGVDPDALLAVALLVPLPFLNACNRRWASSIAASWSEGYCPVCGAWPALAEVRGIERSRYLRCGRCGAGWQALQLSCPYCGMTDHKELIALVPESGGTARVVEACRRCRGYVKAFTTLQASPPAKVIVDDLASVDLDIAAVEEGYGRPEGSGYVLDVLVTGERPPKRSIFFWS